MEEACGMFLTAERRFQKLCAHPDVVTKPKLNIAWWDSFGGRLSEGARGLAAIRRSEPDMRSNILYARFRALLLKGKKLTADA